MSDVEQGGKEVAIDFTPTKIQGSKPESAPLLSKVDDLDIYPGDDFENKVDSIVNQHGVVLFSKSHCPFCLDVKDLLASQIGVPVHALEVDDHPQGSDVQKAVKSKTGHPTVPVVFIKGQYMGGCDDVKALHSKGELEKILSSLIVHKQVMDAEKLETAKLAPVKRGRAVHPLFWFPNVVNNWVVRVTGLQVFALCVLNIVFYEDEWGQYLSVGLLGDFVLRLLVGSSLSPLGMIATFLTAPMTPDFKPGPPKQFAAACGTMFSLVAVCCYFTDNEVGGAIVIGMLAGASGLEGFANFCLGCLFYGWGIKFGLIPDHVYRIYTSSRQETEDSWNYMNLPSNAVAPVTVDTDPNSKIALKYKKKSDEWTKDDFHLVRNMQVNYFGMPLALAGLATAFKIGSDWTSSFRSVDDTFPPHDFDSFEYVPDAWFQTFSLVAAIVYGLFLVLYAARLVLHPHKCSTEWDCPLRSPGFGMVTITMMLFSFLVYDEIDSNNNPFKEETPQKFARVIFWMGSVTHCVLTVAKFGEWVGMRLELEHVHPTWMIFPVGLMVAALCAPVVPMFEESSDNEDKHVEANILVARFFYSFAFLMWVTLFVVTFFKVVTTHNSDNRIRHSVFIWLAAPCVIGLADFAICMKDPSFFEGECAANFAQFYFIGMVFFLGLAWAALPYIGFFGRDKFGMNYWTECFALDTLAACAALFYFLNGFRASKTLMYTTLTIASVANAVAFLHTLASLIRRRGVFTPEVKWGPLSFMKLTHEAFRGALPKIRDLLDTIDLNDPDEKNLKLFAAHYSAFCILHEEHAKHEDEVIFKTFNDYFSEHARKYNDDHEEDRRLMEGWRMDANSLLDVSMDKESRAAKLQKLQKELPSFFDHFEEHLRGEEDNLQPIGRKHLPLEVQKQISRESWRITSAERWEVMIPYIVNNLPRHLQRVRYLKVLCWSMPERAQQIGAIVYRNVDAVMWERLRVEVPEIIPRGAFNWRRYY